MKPEILIEYCPKCNWMLRAAWMAQEILSTFDEFVLKVSLMPSETAGVFRVFVGHELVFDRKSNGGFPELKILKQLIRDKVAPAMDLGHADRMK